MASCRASAYDLFAGRKWSSSMVEYASPWSDSTCNVCLHDDRGFLLDSFGFEYLMITFVSWMGPYHLTSSGCSFIERTRYATATPAIGSLRKQRVGVSGKSIVVFESALLLRQETNHLSLADCRHASTRGPNSSAVPGHS